MRTWQSLQARIIIVHPHYRQHRYLLAALLNLSNIRYLRCDETLDMAWLNDGQNYELFILDEFDRHSSETSAAVVDMLLKAYPNSRLVLFSRHLPDLPLQQRQQAIIFPVDDGLGLVDYLGQPTVVLEFFALGLGAIAVNGKRKILCSEIPEAYVLFYLLEKGRAKRKTLLEIFWPDSSAQAAIKHLHNLKQRLKELLGLELIVFKNGFYQLNPSYVIFYDVANYQRLFDAAHFASSAQPLLQQAQAAYTGDYLQGLKLPWARALRHALRRNQADVQARLAAHYAENAKVHEASAWYAFAFKHNPARDDVLWELMRLFIDLQMPNYALSFYERYEEVLRERHGISPHPRFQDLLAAAQAAS